MKISACLIVKDEERNISECLQSLVVFADEIIVVDTGSTDDTINIAKGFTNKIYSFPWIDDFSAARNYALEKATGDWIVSIDADEIIRNPQQIHTTLQNIPKNVGGILIELESNAHRADGSLDTFIIHLLRVFRNNPLIRWENTIHEQVLESILSAGFSVTQSDIRYFHKGYDLSPEAMRKKQERNLSLLTKSVENRPNDGYMWFQKAKTYRALGQLDKAEIDCKRALLLLSDNHSAKPQALNEMALISYQKNDVKSSLIYANESLKIIPQQSFALYIAAESLYGLKEFSTALECYKAIKDVRVNIMSLITGEYSLPIQQLEFRIGKCYATLNEWDKAEQSFLSGLHAEPNDITCLVGLANCTIRKGEFSDAYALLKKAKSLDPNNSEIIKILEQVERNLTLNNSDTNTVRVSEKYKPLISLSMIVKNEEKRLAECLESVREIVDEIIIVDTGSTDGTMAIAEQYGAKIFHFPWNGDFAEARNKSISFCTGEWILYLDADERIHSEARFFLREMLKKLPDDVGALLCTIRSPHRQGEQTSETHTGAYPRLFRNYGYPNIKFQGRVHEQISPSIIALQKAIVSSEIIIDHIGYDLEKEEMEKKLKRNYELLIRHVREEPENAYAWFQLGQTLARMNIIQEAEEALRLSLQVGGLAAHIEASAAAVLAQLCGNNKRFDEALHWADHSLQKVPQQIFALHLRAFALLYLGRYKESETTFIEVLKRKKISIETNINTGFEVSIDENIILQGLNEAKKAQLM